MKTIFIYVGSRMGNKSKTLEFINLILDRVYKIIGEGNLKVITYTAKDVYISRCNGCIGCFSTGKCKLDQHDNMKIIKQEMLNSDIIILASPVYAHHVSGDMKIFIDRISYWMHLMRLSGKHGIVVSTSGGNGLELVTNYLYKIMTYMGVKVEGKFGVNAYSIDEYYYESVEIFTKLLLECINNKKIETDSILEAVFKANKNIMLEAKKYKTKEFEYWEKSGMIECDTFKEVLDMLK